MHFLISLKTLILEFRSKRMDSASHEYTHVLSYSNCLSTVVFYRSVGTFFEFSNTFLAFKTLYFFSTTIGQGTD